MTRKAFVTGGNRGIGAAIAITLKQAGFATAVNYGGNDAAAQRFSEETGIATIKFDVGNAEASAAGMQRAAEVLDGPIEVLVNNAGIARDSFLHKMSAEQWHDVMNVDLSGLFHVTRPVIEAMRANGFGRIVNIASVNGRAGQMGQTNYAAAKAGVHGFTKALALESAFKGITVNTIAPGYISTEMLQDVPEKTLQKIIAGIPVGRLGDVKDIARAVLFLVADEAGFITGSELSVNGGQHMY